MTLLDERDLTADEQEAYEREADAYFEALDYAYDSIPVLERPIEIPKARVVRRSWWRRLLGIRRPR